MLDDNPPAQERPEGEEVTQPEMDVSAQQGAEQQQGRSNLGPLLIEILQTVLLTLIIFVTVRTVVQNFKVDGASMEPTLHSGQYLLVNKFSYFHLNGLPLQIARRIGVAANPDSTLYLFGQPERGDIIVFRYPGRPDKDFIKRVIGVPGDEVRIERGRVHVNGMRLEEDYISAVPSYSLAPETVPEGRYFVLGDNRPNSSDSHIWGYVPEDNIIGKAWISYWPPGQWGMLADRGLAGN